MGKPKTNGAKALKGETEAAELLRLASEAINAVFSYKGQSAEVTYADLESLKSEIDTMLDALDSDIKEGGN